MDIIECTNRELALNLNPFQIFVMVNDRTRPQLDFFRQSDNRCFRTHLVFLDFEASNEMQLKVSEKIDPMLYYAFMHADIIARLPSSNWDIRPKFQYYIHRFVNKEIFGKSDIRIELVYLARIMSAQLQHTCENFYNSGNVEIKDMLQEVYKDDPDKIKEFSENNWERPGRFITRDFLQRLSPEQENLFYHLMQERLGYSNEEDSKLMMESFLHYKYTEDGGYYDFYPNHDTGSINEPDFKIVIAPSSQRRISKCNYDIMIVKNNQDTGNIVLDFSNEKGAKMIFLLTLLLQKADQGFSLTFFDNDKASELIRNLYDMLYDVGGKEWVDNIRGDKHRASVARSHASKYIKESEQISSTTRYWCAMENRRIEIHTGRRLKIEEIKRIRLPQDMIYVQSNEMIDLIECFPSLEKIVKSPFKETQKDKIRQ